MKRIVSLILTAGLAGLMTMMNQTVTAQDITGKQTVIPAADPGDKNNNFFHCCPVKI